MLRRQTRRKVPRVTKGNQWPSTSIVYICGAKPIAFGPHDTDLGGSEQAVVQLSAYWASQGFPVVVFGNVKECKVDGVEYRSISKLNLGDTFATAIFWRSFGIRLLPLIRAKRRIVDLHDSWDPRSYVSPKDLLSLVDMFMVKSNYHRSLYPYIPDSKIRCVMNGIQMDICESVSKKLDNSVREPFRLVYASNYERGLEPLLKYTWPKIIKEIPEAELHIYYGFNPNAKPAFITHMNQLFSQKGVKEHGKVSLKKIAEEKCRSSVHLYVSNSATEIDCISIRESLVCGSIPVIGTDYVFKERDGVHIKGSTKNILTYKRAGSAVVKLLKDQDKLEDLRERYKHSDTIMSWPEVGKEWIKVLR
jgi:hypothetical protein